jgi:Dip2/Utp12 Family
LHGVFGYVGSSVVFFFFFCFYFCFFCYCCFCFFFFFALLLSSSLLLSPLCALHCSHCKLLPSAVCCCVLLDEPASLDKALIDDEDSDEESEMYHSGQAGTKSLVNSTSSALPGVIASTAGAADASRIRKPSASVRGVAFSPTGAQWAAITPEGLMVYSQDAARKAFDPFQLDVHVTPEGVASALLIEKLPLKALIMALKLGHENTLQGVFMAIPLSRVATLVHDLPPPYLERLLAFLTRLLPATPRLERSLTWLLALLRSHGSTMVENSTMYMSLLRKLHQHYTDLLRDLSSLGESNLYLLTYLLDSLQSVMDAEESQLPAAAKDSNSSTATAPQHTKKQQRSQKQQKQKRKKSASANP